MQTNQHHKSLDAVFATTNRCCKVTITTGNMFLSVVIFVIVVIVAPTKYVSSFSITVQQQQHYPCTQHPLRSKMNDHYNVPIDSIHPRIISSSSSRRRRKQTNIANPISLLRFSPTNGDISNSMEEDDNGNEPIITKEMFLLDMLRHPSDSIIVDPTTTTTPFTANTNNSTTMNIDNNNNNNDNVRIKKKTSKNKSGNGGNYKEYKVFDNRDTMPFAVTVQTPDPYTHPDIKQKNANKLKKRNNAIEERILSRVLMSSSSSSSKKQSTSNKGKHGPSTTNNNDVDDDDSNIMTVLGEYQLEKHTTTGDMLLINNVEYKVLRHRCLYKYAGGQRFVMIKKILEVKEVSRIETEQYLYEQFRKS